MKLVFVVFVFVFVSVWSVQRVSICYLDRLWHPHPHPLLHCPPQWQPSLSHSAGRKKMMKRKRRRKKTVNKYYSKELAHLDRDQD